MVDGTAVVWRDPVVAATSRKFRGRSGEDVVPSVLPDNTPDAGRPARPGGPMTITTESPRLNGVDTATLFATLDAVKGQHEIAKFQFRASNTWVSGTHSRSHVLRLLRRRCRRWSTSTRPSVDVRPPGRARRHRTTHRRRSSTCCTRIAACLTAGLANIAAARGVELTKVTSTVEGDIDLLGILGLSDGSVRNGYEQIRVTFHIEGDADDETLRGTRRAVPPALGRVRRAHQPHPRRDRRRHRLSRRLTTQSRGRPAALVDRSRSGPRRDPHAHHRHRRHRRGPRRPGRQPAAHRRRPRPRRPRPRPRRRALAQRALGLAAPAHARTG